MVFDRFMEQVEAVVRSDYDDRAEYERHRGIARTLLEHAREEDIEKLAGELGGGQVELGLEPFFRSALALAREYDRNPLQDPRPLDGEAAVKATRAVAELHRRAGDEEHERRYGAGDPQELAERRALHFLAYGGVER